MTPQPPPTPENDHSEPLTYLALRDLVTEYAHDRNRVRDALLPTLSNHPYTAHEVTAGDDLQPGYIAERAANLLRHHANQIERLESQLSTTKEHFQKRCKNLTAARDRAVMDKLAELIEQAHANRRTAWDENLGPEIARHWGAVAGFLRHQLPDGHPLASPHVKAPDEHACTCTTTCPEDPTQNTCLHCRALDNVLPCPVIGFGCAATTNIPCRCCTPAQRKASSGATR